MLIAKGFVHNTIIGFFLFVDGVIYNFIRDIYDIFMFLTGVELFEETEIPEIAQRIYIIIGVVMLFVLAYSLLKAIVNPDEFAKGEYSFPNFVKNILISLIIIALLPTLFRVANYVQISIVHQNVIGQLFIPGSTENGNSEDFDHAGSFIALNVFRAFFYPDDNAGDSATTYETIVSEIESGNGNFKDFGQLKKYAGSEDSDEEIVYNFPFSTIAGFFVLWTLLLFCFDLAIRAIKLAFYQIIAPIPVICRIIPHSKAKAIWSNWLKVTMATYFEVFIRLLVMYMGVFFILTISNKFGKSLYVEDFNGFQTLLLKAFLIMGVIAFIKQAPKLIGDIFGINSSDMNLGLKGLKQRLGEGGAGLAFAGGAAIGAGVTAGVKNFVGTKGNIASKLGSGVAGLTGGAARGLAKGASAKSFGDMKKAASAGALKAQENAQKRQLFRAQNSPYHFQRGNSIKDVAKGLGKNIASQTKARGQNAFASVKDFAGIDSFSGLKRQQEAADTMQGFYKTMAGYVEDDKRVASYKGMYEAEKGREIDDKIFDEMAYNQAVETEKNALGKDSRYARATREQLENIAKSRINRQQFERKMTAAERQQAIFEKQEKLDMYDQLIKIATVQAINDKLSDTDANRDIKDSRFQAVKNKAELFKQQNLDLDFVQGMHDIAGFDWASARIDVSDGHGGTTNMSYDDVIKSGNPAAIKTLLDTLKDSGTSPASFFSDSEVAKKASGEAMAKIAKKVEEKKDK